MRSPSLTPANLAMSGNAAVGRFPHGQSAPPRSLRRRSRAFPRRQRTDHGYSGSVTSVTSVTSEDERPLWRRLESWSAPQLLAADFPPLRWAVPNLLPEGCALLVGAPKVGKSWAALDIALAVAGGGLALGALRVETGPVLYLALEDGPRRLADRSDCS